MFQIRYFVKHPLFLLDSENLIRNSIWASWRVTVTLDRYKPKLYCRNFLCRPLPPPLSHLIEIREVVWDKGPHEPELGVGSTRNIRTLTRSSQILFMKWHDLLELTVVSLSTKMNALSFVKEAFLLERTRSLNELNDIVVW